MRKRDERAEPCDETRAGQSMFFESNTTLLDPPSQGSDCELTHRNDLETVRAERPNWLHRGQVPGLDGLRAIAVLLVVMTHAHHSNGFPESPLLNYVFHEGHIGVDIFFVISGFLITTLLVREFDRDGKINLKRFYTRRFIRIIPAYACLLTVVAIAQRLGYFDLKPRDWIGALTYTTNFLYKPSWELGHSWSLSVEEHFYMLWPFVLYFGGIKAGWRFGVGCMVVCCLLRTAIAFGVPALIFPAGTTLHDVSYCARMAENWTFTRLDTISFGCVLALASRSDRWRDWLDRFTNPEMMWIYLVAFCVSLTFTQSSKYNLCASYTLNGFLIAMMIWGCIRSEGTLKRILSIPLFVAVGHASYSIYLWQQLSINPRLSGWIHRFPQNVPLAIAVGFTFYWILEKPLNRLKDRIAR